MTTKTGIAGLVSHESAFGPDETVKRLVAAVEARGMTVFAQIDHATAAAEVELALRPTTVVVFGNARAGTPLMQSARTMAIDLPLRALVWQDDSGATWLSYNDPAWIAKRHGFDPGADRVRAMAAALADSAREAVERAEGAA